MPGIMPGRRGALSFPQAEYAVPRGVILTADTAQVLLSWAATLVVAKRLASEASERFRHKPTAGVTPPAPKVQRCGELSPQRHSNASGGEAAVTTSAELASFCRNHGRVLDDGVQGEGDGVA